MATKIQCDVCGELLAEESGFRVAIERYDGMEDTDEPDKRQGDLDSLALIGFDVCGKCAHEQKLIMLAEILLAEHRADALRRMREGWNLRVPKVNDVENKAEKAGMCGGDGAMTVGKLMTELARIPSSAPVWIGGAINGAYNRPVVAVQAEEGFSGIYIYGAST